MADPMFVTALTKEALFKISRNLNATLKLGITTGFIGVIGYAVTLPGTGWKLLFLAILICAASFISGFFLGFLFGIPKRNVSNESDYNLSTNLVDISDWLTKIIIGLGLIEIKRIPGLLQAIGSYIQLQTGGDNSIKIFSATCIVYFSVFGLYYGYNYMRLFLSGQFKEADDNLLTKQQQLTEKAEELNKQVLSAGNIDVNNPNADALAKKTLNIDPGTQKTLKEYNQLLKTSKTEEDYTFEDWYYKGISEYERQEYSKTIAYMKNALEKDPTAKNAPDAYIYIGLSYYKLRLYDKAIEANDKVANNYKDYPYLYLAYFNNGVYYGEIQNYQKSLEEYEKAIATKADDAGSWGNKALALIRLGRYDEALQAVDKAMSLDPNNPNDYYNKAVAFALKQDKEQMMTNLKKAIELKSDFRAQAKSDADFSAFKDDDDFKNLVA
jgi:tetratricopeptide (TPR) repeat protein